jgi:DNA/RNA-binding domain of Phe-tRNA-synthetase-like protein
VIAVAESLAGVVTLGWVVFEGVRVEAPDPRLDLPLAECERRLRARGFDEASFAAVRAMYRRVGIDPTKTRPSSEALLRRVRKGGPLPRINTLVDISNWCSVESQLPFGLYDRAAIYEPIELRLGQPGEEYAGIHKDTVHVAGRVALVDRSGPFGNPTSDAARTMVTTETISALVVVFGPAGQAAAVRSAIDLTASRVLAIAGGRESLRQVVG